MGSGSAGLTAVWYRLGQQALPSAVPQLGSTLRHLPACQVSTMHAGQGGRYNVFVMMFVKSIGEGGQMPG